MQDFLIGKRPIFEKIQTIEKNQSNEKIQSIEKNQPLRKKLTHGEKTTLGKTHSLRKTHSLEKTGKPLAGLFTGLLPVIAVIFFCISLAPAGFAGSADPSYQSDIPEQLANGTLSLSVSADSIEFDVPENGNSVPETIRVTNTGREDISVRFYFQKDGETDSEILDAFTLSDTAKILKPGESDDLTVILSDTDAAKMFSEEDTENIKLNLLYVSQNDPSSNFAAGIRLPVRLTIPDTGNAGKHDENDDWNDDGNDNPRDSHDSEDSESSSFVIGVSSSDYIYDDYYEYDNENSDDYSDHYPDDYFSDSDNIDNFDESGDGWDSFFENSGKNDSSKEKQNTNSLLGKSAESGKTILIIAGIVLFSGLIVVTATVVYFVIMRKKKYKNDDDEDDF